MKQNRDTDMNLIFVDWEAGAAKLRRVFSQSVVIAHESYQVDQTGNYSKVLAIGSERTCCWCPSQSSYLQLD